MFPDMLVEIAGFSGSMMAFLIFVPQALKTIKNRHNYKEIQETISKGSQWFLVCNATLWGYYAIGTEAFWVGAPGIVNMPLAILSLIYLYRAKNHTKQSAIAAEGVEDEKSSQKLSTGGKALS